MNDDTRNERKNFHGFWKDASGLFSSRQLKGGGIDGRVSPRTGSSDRIVLTHFMGHASRLRLVWECLLLLVLLKMERGLEIRVLETANTRSGGVFSRLDPLNRASRRVRVARDWGR